MNKREDELYRRNPEWLWVTVAGTENPFPVGNNNMSPCMAQYSRAVSMEPASRHFSGTRNFEVAPTLLKNMCTSAIG